MDSFCIFSRKIMTLLLSDAAAPFAGAATTPARLHPGRHRCRRSTGVIPTPRPLLAAHLALHNSPSCR